MKIDFKGTSEKDWKEADSEFLARLKQTPLPSASSVWEGNWESASYTNYSSIDGQALCEIPLFGSDEIDVVVRKARAAISGPSSWSKMHPNDRKKLLLNFHDLIVEASDDLSLLDCIDVGKPFQIAKAVDVGSAARSLEWFAELGDKIYGEVAPTNNIDIITSEPLGVVAAIVPWNYPLMIAAWKFAPILAAGNAVILKPAEQSPLSAMKLAEIAKSANLPDGVFNVVTGDGPTTGNILSSHQGVDAVAFTGSTETGKLVIKSANEKRLKPVSLECGGKSPAILFADCDLQKAVSLIAAGVFYNAGQSCNAPTRILVQEEVSEDAIELIKKEASKFMPNNPMAKDTAVGAVLDREQYEKISKIVTSSVSAGANVEFGGIERMFEDTGGYYMSPTILTSVTPEHPAFQEEIFGPVIPITTFKDVDEAIELANNSRYGLWANVFTKNMDYAMRCGKEIEAGTVALNVTFGGDITTPFGGYKDSGIGRDRSHHALMKYTNIKHISFNQS